MIRARTGAPSSSARRADMTTTAAAASLTPEALPAVTVPSFLKAGLGFAKSPTVALGWVRGGVVTAPKLGGPVALLEPDRHALLAEPPRLYRRLRAAMGLQRELV